MAGVPREGLYILLALGCGVGGYVAQRSFVDAEINQYKEQLTNKKELIALKERVNAGQVLTDALLETVRVPAQFVHPRAVTKADQGSVVGSPVSTPVEKGEVLLWNQMDMGASASVNDKISEGEKAITIPVNKITGCGGLLRPNTRIDVYGTFSVPVKVKDGEKVEADAGTTDEEAKKTELVSTRLLENVVVVSVGTEAGLDYGDLTGADQDKGNYETVTLLVKEQQVERVLLGMELANASGTSLYCVLRSELDKTATKEAPRVVGTSELLKEIKKEP